MAYDPLSADVTEDVTIGAVTYIVTEFSDSGASAVGPDFQTSTGAYRGTRKESGPREASMTVEITNAAQATPAQFATFDFRDQTWVIFQVGRSVSSTGPGTMPLTLRWVSAAA